MDIDEIVGLSWGDLVRFWLIRKLAGRRSVALNLEVLGNGDVLVTEEPLLFADCAITEGRFIGTRVDYRQLPTSSGLWPS